MIACLLGTVEAQGQLIEFCDDWGKPAAEQRDPYEERIETERHDFTQSAITVGRHVLQVERLGPGPATIRCTRPFSGC